jgi:hypothetical protein
MKKAKREDHPIAKLSFVDSRRPGRRFCWNVTPTGNYGEDCCIGRRLALEYLAFEESDDQGPGYLQKIVEDMPRELTGVEVGFLTMVSYAAGAGAYRARQVSAYWDEASA